MASPPKTTSPTIGFRLPSAYQAKLIERATAMDVGLHQCARQLLMDALENTTSKETLDLLRGLREEHLLLRTALARALEAVLLNTTKLSEKTVRSWTREKILHADRRSTAEEER